MVARVIRLCVLTWLCCASVAPAKAKPRGILDESQARAARGLPFERDGLSVSSSEHKKKFDDKAVFDTSTYKDFKIQSYKKRFDEDD